MRKIKFGISLVLSLLIIFTSISPAFALAGNTTPTERIESSSVIGGNLGEWILDESNGYIYAFSSNHDRLLFISTVDLKVKKEIQLPGITDLELANDKLYVAIGSYKQIAVINVKTATVEQRISTGQMPYRIAVDGGKLFYILKYVSGTQQDYAKIYILNLNDSSETVLKPSPDTPTQQGFDLSYYLNAITADQTNHTLYIGVSNGSSSGIFAINTQDFKTLSTNDGARFKGIYSRIFLQGSDIFFGKYRLDAKELSKVYGSYDSTVDYVSGEHVFSDHSVFDRTQFLKTGDLPKFLGTSRYLLDSTGSVYIYIGESYSIEKGALDQYLIKDSGGPVSSDYNAATAVSGDVASRLSITKWLVDENRNMIYALSRENNTLLFIGLSDLTVKKQIVVGKDPASMTLSSGKLYVALSSINQVAIVDTSTQTVKANLVLKHSPGSLAVDGNKLFYLGYNEQSAYGNATKQTGNLFMYDLAGGSEKQINATLPSQQEITKYGDSNMVLDAANHVLYVGGAMFTGVCAINTADYSAAGVSNSSVVNQELGVVAKAGDNLYYSQYKYALYNLDSVYGYFAEPIIYASGDLAFSKQIVYDAGTFEKVATLPFESDSIYLDKSDNVYLYKKDLRVIQKVSLKSALDGFSKAYKALVENTDYSYSVENANSFNIGRKELISNMIVDDKTGYIYAISDSGYKLIVIGQDDLKVKKELIVGLLTTDMKLQDGKLYVASAGTKYIKVIDLTSLTVINKIAVSVNPELLALDGNKLFYSGLYKGQQSMHVYDLLQKTEKPITFYDFKYGWDIHHETALFVDGENHILYGVMGAATPVENFAAINTLDLKPLLLPAGVNKLGSVQLNGMPVFDGNDLFMGQHYNRTDFSLITPALVGKILYVDDTVIITSYSAYLRSNNAKLGDLPEYTETLGVDSQYNAYALPEGSRTIKKTSIYEILSSMVNKTAEGRALNIDGYLAGNVKTDILPDSDITFSDLASHWAKDDIVALAARHIISGTGDGNFSPSRVVTRAEFVTMLVRALNVSDSNGDNPEFLDIDVGAWYYSSVVTATKLGLVNGTGDGRFAPDAPITREEIASLTIRALNYMETRLETADNNALSIFTDKTSISGWAKDNMAMAVKVGVIKGMPGGILAPHSMTTRAESAVILKRILTYEELQ